MGLVTLLVVNIWPTRSWLRRRLRIRPNPRPISGRCLIPFDLYGSVCSVAPTLTDPMDVLVSLFSSFRPLRPQFDRSLWLWMTPRPFGPHCLSAFGLYGPSFIAAFGFGRTYGRLWVAACRPSSYTVQDARHPRLGPILWPSWFRCLLAFGVYGIS